MFAMSRMVTTPMMRPLSLMATAPAPCSRIMCATCGDGVGGAGGGDVGASDVACGAMGPLFGRDLRDVGEGEEPEVVIVVEDRDPAAVLA